MKNKLHFFAGYLVALVCIAPLAANGATKKSRSPAARPSVTPKPKSSPASKTTPSPSPSPSAHPTVGRAIGFHGKISAVDQKAKTFTVGARVFKITDKTVMTKAGTSATMKDVVVNEEVRGSYWKVMDGSLEAKTVKLGPKTDAEKAADEKVKARKKEKERAAESSASPSASPKP
jgi:hypothetical protein